MKNSEYQQTALDFLSKYKIEFNTQFAGFRKHFEDDKEKRNTYECKFLKREYPLKEISIIFGQSIANTEKRKAPTAYDVLSCITKSNPESFDNFCVEYGYNTDSRKHFSTWESVCKEWVEVSKFFTQIETSRIARNSIINPLWFRDCYPRTAKGMRVRPLPFLK